MSQLIYKLQGYPKKPLFEGLKWHEDHTMIMSFYSCKNTGCPLSTVTLQSMYTCCSLTNPVTVRIRQVWEHDAAQWARTDVLNIVIVHWNSYTNWWLLYCFFKTKIIICYECDIDVSRHVNILPLTFVSCHSFLWMTSTQLDFAVTYKVTLLYCKEIKAISGCIGYVGAYRSLNCDCNTMWWMGGNLVSLNLGILFIPGELCVCCSRTTYTVLNPTRCKSALYSHF